MDLSKRLEIAKRQNERADILLQKRILFYRSQDKYRSFFLDVDKNEDRVFKNISERKSEQFNIIINTFIKHQKEYDQYLKEINDKYPWFNSEEFKNSLVTMWNYEYDYYKELIDYLNMLDGDFKAYFSDSYKKKTFEMAQNGVFLFYELTPDFEEFLCDDVNKNLSIVLNYFAMDGFGPLRQMLSEIFIDEDPDDFLRTVKTRELKEAVACLINGCYGSCARTMLALIENEHTNASSINRDFFENKITKGKDRSIEITNQLDEIHITYFSECWKLLNDFYKEITLNSSKKSNRFINRNEVVHGVYWDAILPDRDSCTELVLFYLSFKHISYFLQEVFDMKVRIKEDSTAALARIMRDNA